MLAFSYTRPPGNRSSASASVCNDPVDAHSRGASADCEATPSERSAASSKAPRRARSTASEASGDGGADDACIEDTDDGELAAVVEVDEGLKAEEDIIKQRSETVFRRQEEEWLMRREKVSSPGTPKRHHRRQRAQKPPIVVVEAPAMYYQAYVSVRNV